MTPGWQAQARDILRSELAVAATDVFAAEGFDAVTVDDVAQRLGISRATFFRYFSSKDEAVLATLDSIAGGYAATLEAFDTLVVRDGETIWGAVRRVLDSVTDLSTSDPGAVRRRIRMVMSTPTLRTRFRQDRLAREERFAGALEKYVPDRLAAEAIAAAALAGLDAAWRTWAEDTDGTSDLRAILDRVTAALTMAGLPQPSARADASSTHPEEIR